MNFRFTSQAFVFLFLISIETSAEKTLLLFNGGGTAAGEILKNKSMVDESRAAIDRMIQAGYKTDGNLFVRDGSPIDGAITQRADGEAFLMRVRQICALSKKRDDIVISLGGHGVPDPSVPKGRGGIPGTRAVGYGHDNPQNSNPLSPELIAAVEAYLKAHLKAGEVLAHFNTKQNTLSDSERTQIWTEVEESAKAESEAREALAKALGTDPVKASHLFFDAQNRFDVLSPSLISKDLAAYLKSRLDSPDSKETRNASSSGLDNGVQVQALEKAMGACKRNGARVRIVGTQCYSGAFNELGDEEGLVCTSTLTGPFSTSSAFDMWRNSHGALSPAEITESSQDREDNDPNSDKMNNETQDNSEHIVSRWIDSVAQSCQNGVAMQCVDRADQEKLCAVIGNNPPIYFKRSSDLYEQRPAPASLVSLLEMPQTPQTQNPSTPYQNPHLDEIISQLGFGQEQIKTQEDAEKVARLLIAKVESDPQYALKVKIAFFISSAIDTQGKLNPQTKEGVTHYIADNIGSNILRRSSHGIDSNIDVIRHRKETYTAAFKKFATGNCKKSYENARTCLEASFSENDSGDSNRSSTPNDAVDSSTHHQ